MPIADPWDPDRYARFAAERRQPFDDLLDLVAHAAQGRSFARAVDLGCGTGELTAVMHRRLAPNATVGIDNSPAMLERATAHTLAGLTFARADIARFADVAAWDLIVSNAALQWVPDHPALFARLRRALSPGGHLAVQVPANADHPAHRLAFALAAEPPFAGQLAAAGDDPTVPGPVLTPQGYSTLLHDLGFADQHVRLQVYPHLLSGPDELIAWLAGTTFTRFARALSEPAYASYLERFRAALPDVLAPGTPLLYTFNRVLIWARLPSTDAPHPRP